MCSSCVHIRPVPLGPEVHPPLRPTYQRRLLRCSAATQLYLPAGVTYWLSTGSTKPCLNGPSRPCLVFQRDMFVLARPFGVSEVMVIYGKGLDQKT